MADPVPGMTPKRGRPRGSGRKQTADREGMHQGRKPDDRLLITRNGQTYEYVGDDETDRLHVPAHMIPQGMVYLWVTDSILGQPMQNWRSRRARTGWNPVPASRHDGLWMPKGHQGEINVDGLVLCEKPIEFVERDRIKDKRNAAEQVYIRERAMMSGDAVAENVGFDSRSDKGRKANRVGKNYEAVPVPANNYERE